MESWGGGGVGNWSGIEPTRVAWPGALRRCLARFSLWSSGHGLGYARNMRNYGKEIKRLEGCELERVNPICVECRQPIREPIFATCLECRRPMHKKCFKHHLCNPSVSRYPQPWRPKT